MRDSGELLATLSRDSKSPSCPWRISSAGPRTDQAPRRSLLGRILGRQETTTYQRCLAVHIHYAGPRSALS